MLAGPGSISLLIALREEFQKSIEMVTALTAVTLVLLYCFSNAEKRTIYCKMAWCFWNQCSIQDYRIYCLAIGIEYICTAVIDIIKTTF